MNNHISPPTSLVFLFMVIFFPSAAQQAAPAIPIPMKNGIVWYENEGELRSGSDKKAEARSQDWMRHTFPQSKITVLTEQGMRKLVTTGFFKIPVSESGNYFWIRMKIVISVQAGRRVLQCYEYYEKPVEKGVSNEYSKIEYRWWDFRQGKPWSPEDKNLFEGLNRESLALADSWQAMLK